jgi:hypothetical protein
MPRKCVGKLIETPDIRRASCYGQQEKKQFGEGKNDENHEIDKDWISITGEHSSECDRKPQTEGVCSNETLNWHQRQYDVE